MPRKKREIKDIWGKPFPTRLRVLLAEQRTSRQTLASYLDVTSQTVGAYCDGTSYPSIDNLIKISQFFCVSTDYLLGLSDIRSTDNNIRTVCATTGLSVDAVASICTIKENAPNLMPYFNKLLELHHGAGFSGLLAVISQYISNKNTEFDSSCYDATCTACIDELEKRGFVVADPQQMASNRFYDLMEMMKKTVDEIANAAKEEAKNYLADIEICDEVQFKNKLISAMESICISPTKKAAHTVSIMLDKLIGEDARLRSIEEHAKRLIDEVVSEKNQ